MYEAGGVRRMERLHWFKSFAPVSLLPFFQWLDASVVAETIRDRLWMFPTILTAHVLGTVLLAGTVSVLDLRLLGRGMRRQAVSDMAEQLLPWTWTGFAMVAASGIFLLTVQAVKAYSSTTFWTKIALLAVAGLNMAFFHFNVYRSVKIWDKAPVPPLAARVAGGLSLILWIAIIAAGHMLPYEFY
jgi:hypothetical protein